MLKRYLLGILIVVMVLVFALPALAQSGCEVSRECLGEDYLQYIPSGMDFASTNSMYLYNPTGGGYWVGGFYGMKALCSNYGGYWYISGDGEYYNAC